MGSSGRLPTGNRRQPAPQHFAVAFGKLSGASSAPNLQMDEARNMCRSSAAAQKVLFNLERFHGWMLTRTRISLDAAAIGRYYLLIL
jgi:hypothetical protein